ncbi:MAG: hypothetical protein NTZ03_13825 [Actinobacteria bacterium]|nr:hypothetical protein [Actinomycetota bacterium]
MTDVVIKMTIDVLAALHEDRLDGNMFAFDTARSAGSHGLGTSALATAVKPGDRLLWLLIPLECEAEATIDGISIPGMLAAPRTETESSIMETSAWHCSVGTIDEALPYSITLTLGRNGRELTLVDSLSLIPSSHSDADSVDERVDE